MVKGYGDCEFGGSNKKSTDDDWINQVNYSTLENEYKTVKTTTRRGCRKC